MPIEDAISLVNRFKGGDLAGTVGRFERRLRGADKAFVMAENSSGGISRDLLMAAADVKRASAQIDVVIHAAGILLALPHILDKDQDEKIVSVSLGAGSAGSAFDLVTSHRIAEFKFIHWQGGAESVRKQTLFQDFYRLVREPTPNQKELYLLNIEIPLSFLRGRSSAVDTLRRRNSALAEDYASRYGSRYKTVGEFYRAHKAEVKLVDLISVASEFADLAAIVANESEGA